LVLGLYERVDFFFGLFAVVTVSFLQFADHRFRVALNLSHIVIGEFSPLAANTAPLPVRLAHQLQRKKAGSLCPISANKEKPMLWTIFVILLILWLLGMVSSYTIGGFIHILLIVALVILVLNLIGGRRTI
jgi:hypothetical protein